MLLVNGEPLGSERVNVIDYHGATQSNDRKTVTTTDKNAGQTTIE